MKFLSVVCFVAIFVVITSSSKVNEDGRIIGGSIATEGAYPYMALVLTPGPGNVSYMCGGAILNEYWVASAANCGPATQIWIGSNNYQNQSIRYSVFTRVFFNYNNITSENDIQLLRLTKKITFIPGRIQPISIYNETIPNDAQLSFSGWGTTQQLQVTNNLQTLNYTYLNQSMCMLFNKMTPKKIGTYYYENSNLCALPSIRTGSCYGDYGGPLVYNGQLVGIASKFMGLSCACGYPDVFVNIPYFAAKIAKVIAK